MAKNERDTRYSLYQDKLIKQAVVAVFNVVMGRCLGYMDKILGRLDQNENTERFKYLDELKLVKVGKMKVKPLEHKSQDIDRQIAQARASKAYIPLSWKWNLPQPEIKRQSSKRLSSKRLSPRQMFYFTGAERLLGVLPEEGQ